MYEAHCSKNGKIKRTNVTVQRRIIGITIIIGMSSEHEYRAQVSNTSVEHECRARVSNMSVKHECKHDCWAQVSSKSVEHECRAQVFSICDKVCICSTHMWYAPVLCTCGKYM